MTPTPQQEHCPKPLGACPVDEEGLLLRLQRIEDHEEGMQKNVDVLVGELRALVSRLGSIELAMSKVTTVERDVTFAFDAIRTTEAKLEATIKEAVSDIKQMVSKHVDGSDDWRKREFDPIRNDFLHWKGRFVQIGAVFAFAVGLLQWIAIDKLSIVTEHERKIDEASRNIAVINEKIESHKLQHARDFEEMARRYHDKQNK